MIQYVMKMTAFLNIYCRLIAYMFNYLKNKIKLIYNFILMLCTIQLSNNLSLRVSSEIIKSIMY